MKYLPRIIKRLIPSTLIRTNVDRTGSIGSNCYCLDVSLGKYSYCGKSCKLINVEIGNYSSIADSVVIGIGNDHPINWVSSSPAFYTGNERIKKDFAILHYIQENKKTIIGNDVWIGQGAIIKSGIIIGDGAIVGMGAIVTHDVPPYAIVAGVPARIINYRFTHDIINQLCKIKWWTFEEQKLRKYVSCFDDVEKFCTLIEKENNIYNK